MDFVWNLLLTFFLLSIMIVIHELGHFLFAKLFRVTVLEFSIGMGPAIFTTRKKEKNKKIKGQDFEIADRFHSGTPDEKSNESESVSDDESTEFEEKSLKAETLEEQTDVKPEKTVFSIRALPIGGYVSMAGEDEASTDKNAFCNKPVWQRFIITVAGAVMNILLGIACMSLLVGIESSGDTLASNTIAEFYIYTDSEGNPLYEDTVSDKGDNALMVGDTVVKVNGVPVHTGNELVYEIMNSGYESVDLVVLRDGKRVTLNDVDFPKISEGGVEFGQYDFKVYREEVNFQNVIKHGVFRSFSTVKVIIDSIVDLIGGRYGMDAVSGPVGMASAVGEATKGGFTSILYLFTLITMNLGVFNLLPIPALDGGRIIFLIIEGIARRPIKRQIEHTINTVGLMILMALMLFVTFKDIFGLF